jgi:hypothetical protein
VLVHREMEKWQPCYSSLTGGQSHEKKAKELHTRRKNSDPKNPFSQR